MTDRLIDRFMGGGRRIDLRYGIQTQCLRQTYMNASMRVWIAV